MTERDELPNWTGGPQERPGLAAQATTPPPRRGRTALLAILGFAVLIGMGAVGYFIAQNQADDSTTTDGEVAAPTADPEAADDSATAADAIESVSDDDAPDEAADDGSDSESNEATDDTETTPDNPEGGDDAAAESTRTAVFRGGKLYLGGKVPSEEVAELIAGKAMAVVGPDNVVVEYEIDPNVVIDPGESTPLFVEDVVLFGFNSVSIEPPFVPLLDLGTLLLSQNPQATLTVVTRTDAVGSEEVNLDVATKRADAVIAYWVGKGVNPDQLVSDPRGEEGASEDDDEQTAALQRRAEFIITGLLD